MEHPKTPELDRQHKAIVEGHAHEIGAFIEWLDGRAPGQPPEAAANPRYQIVITDDDGDVWAAPSAQRLLAEYFGIDLAKVDAEKKELLAHLHDVAQQQVTA